MYSAGVEGPGALDISFSDLSSCNHTGGLGIPMRTRIPRLAILAGTTLLAASLTTPALAQDASAAPTLDPADRGSTVRIGFPSGSRDATASSPADIWAQHLGLFDQVFGA